MKKLLLLALLVVGCDNSTEPEDCILDCANECNKNVELWGECFNIEETTELYMQNGNLSSHESHAIICPNPHLDTCYETTEITEIPSEIDKLINLKVLHISESSSLSGIIPSSIWNLINLNELKISSRNLIGTIPPEIGNLTNLTTLYLNLKNLHGIIPIEIGNLTNLNELIIINSLEGKSEISGEIPSEIGNLTNLYGLYLSDNHLTSIHENFCEIKSNFSENNSIPTLSFWLNSICEDLPSCLTAEEIGYQHCP